MHRSSHAQSTSVGRTVPQSLRFTALRFIPEIVPGKALVDVLADALASNECTLADHDVAVFCQKIESA